MKRRAVPISDIMFVTSNVHKVEEVRAAISAAGLSLTVEQRDMGYPEVQVDTLDEVVKYGLADIEARLPGGKVERPVMIEDSGLFVDQLKGFPGVYSSYVFRTLGYDGVLRLMKGAPRSRGATFKSVIGLLSPWDKAPMLFRGACRGTIALEARGKDGFGYDPVFVPREGNRGRRTFAQMTRDEKNSVSHRGRSVEVLVAFLGRGR